MMGEGGAGVFTARPAWLSECIKVFPRKYR